MSIRDEAREILASLEEDLAVVKRPGSMNMEQRHQLRLDAIEAALGALLHSLAEDEPTDGR